MTNLIFFYCLDLERKQFIEALVYEVRNTPGEVAAAAARDLERALGLEQGTFFHLYWVYYLKFSFFIFYFWFCYYFFLLCCLSRWSVCYRERGASDGRGCDVARVPALRKIVAGRRLPRECLYHLSCLFPAPPFRVERYNPGSQSACASCGTHLWRVRLQSADRHRNSATWCSRHSQVF